VRHGGIHSTQHTAGYNRLQTQQLDNTAKAKYVWIQLSQLMVDTILDTAGYGGQRDTVAIQDLLSSAAKNIKMALDIDIAII